MSNKKVIILVIVLAVIGVFVAVTLNKQEKSSISATDTNTVTDVVNNDINENALVTYNDSQYRFSFDYPKDDFIETWSDDRFLRVQSYNPEEFTRSMDGEYWLEFFSFTSNNGSSTCSQRFETYETKNQSGLEVYTGRTKADEQSGIAGLQGWCVNREGIDLYAQGQDETREKIVTQILDSIKFTN